MSKATVSHEDLERKSSQESNKLTSSDGQISENNSVQLDSSKDEKDSKIYE